MREYINLIEAMSQDQATQELKKHGLDPTQLSFADLKSRYHDILKKMHPDLNNGKVDHDTISNLNSAFDFFKTLHKIQKEKNAGSGTATNQDTNTKPKDDPWAWWAQAGWSGGMRNNSSIHRNDTRDLNFIKKLIGEKAGRGSKEYTVQNFDGYFFRGIFTVYGNPSLFKLMAECMIQWDNHYSHRAIFVQERGKQELLLVWSDGHFHNPPIPFEHESFNSNPGNDQRFVRNLPKHLDEIKMEVENGDEPKGSSEEPEKWHRVTIDHLKINPKVLVMSIIGKAEYCFRTLGKGFAHPDMKESTQIYNQLIKRELVDDLYDHQKWAISSSADQRQTFFYFKSPHEAQIFLDRYN